MDTPELAVAEAAARAGAEVASRHFREVTGFRSKDVSNLVTDADIEAERAIVEAIRRAYPDHAILGEEEQQHGDIRAEHLWIIDPIDGTNNFAHKLPQFAVSVAYYRAGVAECGAILSPITGDRYLAARGRGATHNGRPVRVDAEQRRLSQSLIAVGFYYDRGAMMEATLSAIADLFRAEIHGVRRFGAATLDFCMVGAGQFGAFFEYQLAPWDFAAARLFVEEAGGRVTTASGEPLPLATSSVLASNGLLHDEMLAIVAQHHPAPAG